MGFQRREYTLEEIARATRKKEDQPLLVLLRRGGHGEICRFRRHPPPEKTDDMKAAFAYIRSTREPATTEASSVRRGGKQFSARRLGAAGKERSVS